MEQSVLTVRWLRNGVLMLVLVAAMCAAVYGCPIEKQLVVERDRMFSQDNLKPSLGALSDALSRCGWTVSKIQDDDMNCDYSLMLEDAKPSTGEYLLAYEDLDVPPGKHKVHILGADLSRWGTPKYAGIYLNNFSPSKNSVGLNHRV